MLNLHRENDYQRRYLPYYFTNGLIHSATTALLEDGVREDAAQWARGRTEHVEVLRSLFAVTIHEYGLDGLYRLCTCHNIIIIVELCV